MKKINWRRWNNIIHRDFGYFFFGVTLIYAISGIALNHKVMKDWNPEYIIENKLLAIKQTYPKTTTTKEQILNLLDQYNERDNYKNHYFPDSIHLKIFVKEGMYTVNNQDTSIWIEKSTKRLIFNEFDWFHYNPNRWWTWFSDIYAIALALLAITGLFIIRGKKGITGRGAWLTIAGIIIPVLFLIFFR